MAAFRSQALFAPPAHKYQDCAPAGDEKTRVVLPADRLSTAALTGTNPAESLYPVMAPSTFGAVEQ